MRKFSGPHVIEKKLSEADYVVVTPEKFVCHVNMLKWYFTHSDFAAPPPSHLLL